LNRIWANQYDEALALLEKSSRINLRLYGRNHLRFATDLGNLGIVYLQRADYDEAIRVLSDALAIWRGLLGSEDNLRVVSTIYNLGAAYRGKGERLRALEMFQRALKIRLDNHGPEHQRVAVLRGDIGALELEMGSLDEARDNLASAVATLDALDDQEGKVTPMLGLAEVDLAAREPGRAAQQLERALSICPRHGCAASATAEGLFQAAQRLAERGADPRQTARAAEQALAILRELPGGAERASEVEAWLRRPAAR
jgi:tetratricopeptide (TPR) repeat protein